MNAWVEAVAALWPDAEVTVERSSGRPRAARTPAVREFGFLPDADRPRLLLPTGLPRAAAAALRRYSHDLGPVERTVRGLTAAAIRTGLADRALRDRLRVAGDGESVETHLTELLGREVVVSVGLGNARANRKPVLGVVTPDGESVAFVKVGDTPTARELIAGEAAALATLASYPLRAFTVPRVLHHGDWRGLSLLVLSALPTGARSLRSRRSAPVDAMAELYAALGTERTTLAGSAFVERSREASPADPEQAKRLTEVVDRVEAAYGDETLDFGAWHGDWTPWNMAWHHGPVRVWDWERFDTGVPRGLDLLHYRLQQASGDPYRVWPRDAARLLEPFGVTGRAAAVTVELYLLELCRRYLVDADGPTGEPLRPRAAGLLDLLYADAGRGA